MKLPILVSSGALMLCLTVPAMTAMPAGQAPPAPPKPGPQHDVLKMDVGTWDAVVESAGAPGEKTTTTKGVEVNTLGCGGLCLITDFKGEAMPGVPFQGHGVTTWDAAKKKYVGSWTDSMSQGMMIGETTWDAAGKKMSGSMEGPDMTGKVTKMRSVIQYGADGTRVMTAYIPLPDGKEVQAMKISYKRRSK